MNNFQTEDLSFLDIDFELMENYLNINTESGEKAATKRRATCEINNKQASKRSCKNSLIDSNNCTSQKLEKRNARERKRVHQVNTEFEKLKELVIKSNYFNSIKLNQSEYENDSSFDDKENYPELSMELDGINKLKDNYYGRRLSKLKTLRLAIEYINYLTRILNETTHEPNGIDRIHGGFSQENASSPESEYMMTMNIDNASYYISPMEPSETMYLSSSYESINFNQSFSCLDDLNFLI